MGEPRLRPCPFCDGPAEVAQSWSVDIYGWWYAGCTDEDDTCPAAPTVCFGEDDENKVKAIEFWNRRFGDAP